MKHVLIISARDQEIIQESLEEFSGMSKQELVDCYNRQVETGIVGVRRQSLYLCALREVFNEVFGDSPVGLEDGVLLDMKGKIMLAGDVLLYLENSNPN